MISMENLFFNYGKKGVLNNLNLKLEKGNIYGLLGKNGAGKTTILKLLSGELFSKQGSISIFSRNPASRSPLFLSDLFYIPEEFTLPPMRMKDYTLLTAPFYPGFQTEKYRMFLDEFEISDENEKLNRLSYGQQKKFLLAFGLAAGTSLLLLDEPTNGLDIPSKTQFRRTVASALGENQIFLISTHQVRDMENLIDPLIIIDQGELLLNNSLEEISKRYIMKKSLRGISKEETLYSEEVPGGAISLKPRKAEDEETAIDLEILFNYITSYKGESQ